MTQLLKTQLKLHLLLSDPTSPSGVDVLDRSTVAVLQMPCAHQPKARHTYGPLKSVQPPPSSPSTAQQGSPASSTMRDRLCQGKALLTH